MNDKQTEAIDTCRHKRPGFLQDQSGISSSKRLCGVSMLAIGIAMGIILFAFGLTEPEATHANSYDVMQSFLIAGTSLLGLGLIDNLNKIFEKKQKN